MSTLLVSLDHMVCHNNFCCAVIPDAEAEFAILFLTGALWDAFFISLSFYFHFQSIHIYVYICLYMDIKDIRGSFIA